jgi:glycine betaine/proline transport system substrate-binding protein
MKKSATRLIGIAVLAMVLSIVLAACSSDDDEKMTITVIDGNWSSINVQAEIASQIIGDKLGYPTTKLISDVTPGWAALCNKDAHVALEAWLPSRLAEIQPFIDKDCVELGGTNYPGSVRWFVPRYVVEGDAERGIEAVAPNLRSVSDMNEYWELFENVENPGKGEIVAGMVSWIDQPQDISRIAGYDLNYYRSNQGEAVILARVKAAVLKGEPILFYLWTPHGFFGEVDAITLEEPNPYVEGECFVEENIPYKCAHPAFDIRTVVNADLQDEAEDVYNLITNFSMDGEVVSDMIYQIDSLDRDIVEVAGEWIEAHQSEIDGWIDG